METFFQNQIVQTWGSVPVFGTLSGTVSRTGNSVALGNMQLSLHTLSAVSGTKHYTFSVGNKLNNIDISVSNTTNLGTYNLSTAVFSVGVTQTRDRVPWRSTESINGYFYVSFPAPPIIMGVQVDEIGENYMVLRYGVSSFGSPTNGIVKLLGGTTPTTEIASSTKTGYNKFVYSGLTPNTTYYFKTTATNGQMDAESSVTSESTLRITRFYGGVNGKAKRVYKLYVGVDGVAKRAEFYGSQDGEAKRIL